MNPREYDGAADALLLRAVAAGDERALAELYDRHAGWVLARMRHRCASADVVDQHPRCAGRG